MRIRGPLLTHLGSQWRCTGLNLRHCLPHPRSGLREDWNQTKPLCSCPLPNLLRLHFFFNKFAPSAFLKFSWCTCSFNTFLFCCYFFQRAIFGLYQFSLSLSFSFLVFLIYLLFLLLFFLLPYFYVPSLYYALSLTLDTNVWFIVCSVFSPLCSYLRRWLGRARRSDAWLKVHCVLDTCNMGFSPILLTQELLKVKFLLIPELKFPGVLSIWSYSAYL